MLVSSWIAEPFTEKHVVMCEIELLETESFKTLCHRMIHCFEALYSDRISRVIWFRSGLRVSWFRSTSERVPCYESWSEMMFRESIPGVSNPAPGDLPSYRCQLKPTCTSWLRCPGLLDNYRQVCWSRGRDPWSIHYIYISQTHLS